MTARVVLGLGLGLLVALLVRQVSGGVPPIAGSNRVTPAVFAANVSGGMLCQPTTPLPDDAARARITIGTYGKPVPGSRLRFVSSTGVVSAEGQSAAGGREGVVSIALTHHRGAPPASRLCLGFSDRTRVAVAGESAPPGPSTAALDGTPQGGVISVIYDRGRARSWWSALPALTQRFGRGKAAFFGDWTLPACAVAVLGVWIFTVRLLGRELT